MVLSYFFTRFVVKPENINANFSLAEWNANNPDFYVPPHPLMYLVYLQPWSFVAAALVNIFLPLSISHVSQIGILAISMVTSSIQGLQLMPSFFWKTIYAIFYYAIKAFEWQTLMDLLHRAHILFTQHNVYFWVLNYLNFGIFASWPMLRPDLFVQYEEYYCMFWSC